MKNILIIGGSGFLGRNLIKYLKNNFEDVNLFILAHSEYRISLLKKNINNIKIFIFDIGNNYEWYRLDDIVLQNKIDTIINCAAMKHVDLCEENIIKTLNTNVIFCDKLVTVANKYNIKNLIGISTDKANNPHNIYGMSKYMMEKIYLNNNYKIFKGVNFFGSDGSVLEIWYNQYINKQPLTYTNLNSCRYYNKIETVCETIIKNIKSDNKIILTNYVYKIYLKDLLEGFIKYFNYNNTKEIIFNDYEKNSEDLIIYPNQNVKIIELNDINKICELIETIYKKDIFI